MAEENNVTVHFIADFFCEEYGWIAAKEEREVRADLAERWISEGKALPAEKKT